MKKVVIWSIIVGALIGLAFAFLMDRWLESMPIPLLSETERF